VPDMIQGDIVFVIS